MRYGALRLLPLIAALPVVFLLALSVGSITIEPAAVWAVLQGSGSALDTTLIQELRLPRSYSAFVTGGMLALAGALIQILLRNPLGDPYVLGVSGGASVGALSAMLVQWSGWSVTLAATIGAFLSMLLVFGLTGVQRWTTQRLLLTGIVIAAGWGALISLTLAVSPTERLPGMIFWLMGDLAHTKATATTGLILAGGLLLSMWLAPQLNLLIHGEQQAASLGVEVTRMRMLLFLLSSLLTAAAVTHAGNIGFVGLVAPHLFRLWGGSDHRVLLPGAMLVGGILLLLSDTLARTVIAPQQLPVGTLTAIIGVPLFLYLLNRR